MEYLNANPDVMDERAKLLVENKYTINYGPERARQVKTELGQIALEIICQQLESQGYEPAKALGSLALDYFGYYAEPKGEILGTATVGFEV